MHARGTTVRLLTLVLILTATGCAFPPFHIQPKEIPTVEGRDDLALSGTQVSLINAEEDQSDYHILLPNGRYSSIANRHLWTEKLIEGLRAELGKRDAAINSTASNKLRFSIPEIAQENGAWGGAARINVKVAVSSSSGWSKTYGGTAFARKGTTVRDIIVRASSFALADVVKNMLSDKEFLAQIKQ